VKPIQLAALAYFIILSSLSFGQECGIIYVTPSGATSGVAGTKANPASLLYGLTLVTPTDTIVWLADGNYPISNTLSIPNGVTIEGTFNPITWEKTNANTSTIARDATNPDMVNLALIALEGIGISNFRLQDLNITVANAPSTQITVYGIRLSGCSSYNITRCVVTVGNGSNGLGGSPGTSGIAGSIGSVGIQGDDDNIITVCGGNGGAGGGAGSGAAGAGVCTTGGGSGFTGGAGGTPTSQCAGGGGGGGAGGGQNDNTGGNGGTGGGWSSSNNGVGTGGDGSGAFCNNTSGCGSSVDGTNGANGGNGAIGTPGAGGPAGTNAGGYYIPGGPGSSGICGTGGQGGAGGGGAGGEGSPFCQNGTGSTGGGGGGGGEGGSGGTGGTGGGASYCIYLFNNGASGIVQDCDLNAGTGGTGGIGGTGGAGSAGGTGGAGFPWFDSDMGCSGAGGNGGSGGTGGTGGNGVTGSSLQIYEHPGGVIVSQLGINLLPGNPPIITVLNPGCAFSPVTFSSTTSGNWNFGAGANPATGSGPGPISVTYSTLGRKTIIFSGTTFTDYIHIFNTGTSGNFISPQDTTVFVGCPYTFTSTLSGIYYEWWIGGGTPDTIADSTSQTIDSIFFLAPGVYTIILQVTTNDSCCAVAFDTTTVTVDTSSLSLSLTSSIDTICQGDSITFTASGAYPLYQFFVNGSLVQNSPSNTFITTALLPGDSVVAIAFAGACFTNPSDTLTPEVLPVPTATIVSSDPNDTICSGESITFTSAPSGYANYDFLINGVSMQSGPGNIFTTTGLSNGDSVSVLVPNIGCAGPSSNVIIITVEAAPVVTMLSSDPDTTICDGDTITFTVIPPGSAIYGFYHNGVLVQSSGIDSIVAVGLSNGDWIYAAVASSNGCVGLTDTMYVTVNPIPTVTITGSTDSICLNDIITFSATPATHDNYEFFVNGISAQSGASSIFNSSTIVNGDIISVIGTNLGCPSLPDSTGAITVISGPLVTLTSTTDTICPGGSVSFTATPPGYANYDFYIGSNLSQSGNSNIFTTTSILSTDTVSVYATDFVCAGPQSNLVVIIVDYPLATLSSTDTTICSGDPVTITANPAGYSNYEFFINGISVQSGVTFNYGTNTLTNGDTVTVVVTSILGCVGPVSTALIFTVNPIPTVSIAESSDTICLGDLSVFTATPAGYDNYDFYVNTTLGGSGTSNTYSTTGILNGDTITVYATNLGCTSTASTTVPIYVISGPVVTLISDDSDSTICAGTSVTFTANPGGLANYNFFVNSIPVQTGTSNTYTTSTLVNGDSISVIASDLTCPGLSSNVMVFTVDSIPQAILLNPLTVNICDKDTVTITASPSGFSSYEFFVNGNSVYSGPSNTLDSSGFTNGDVITVVPTNNGCVGTVSNSTTINVNQLPNVGFTADTVCQGSPTTLTANSVSNALTWVWTLDGNILSGQPLTYIFSDSGTFNVQLTIIDSNSCTDSSTMAVVVKALPDAIFSTTPDTATILNPLIDFIDLSIPPAPDVIVSWNWDFGDGSTSTVADTSHEYLDTGTYIVTLTVSNSNCTDQFSMPIVIESEFIIFMPNSFTPNGDGLNEFFPRAAFDQIPGLGLDKKFEMYIYDRWGDLIFESHDINQPWDGTANKGKKLAQEDVYVWIIYAKDTNGKKHEFVGHVTLIR